MKGDNVLNVDARPGFASLVERVPADPLRVSFRFAHPDRSTINDEIHADYDGNLRLSRAKNNGRDLSPEQLAKRLQLALEVNKPGVVDVNVGKRGLRQVSAWLGPYLESRGFTDIAITSIQTTAFLEPNKR